MVTDQGRLEYKNYIIIIYIYISSKRRSKDLQWNFVQPFYFRARAKKFEFCGTKQTTRAQHNLQSAHPVPGFL